MTTQPLVPPARARMGSGFERMQTRGLDGGLLAPRRVAARSTRTHAQVVRADLALGATVAAHSKRRRRWRS